MEHKEQDLHASPIIQIFSSLRGPENTIQAPATSRATNGQVQQLSPLLSIRKKLPRLTV